MYDVLVGSGANETDIADYSRRVPLSFIPVETYSGSFLELLSSVLKKSPLLSL